MILSLIIIHVGLFVFYTKLYREIDTLKQTYEEDRAQVKVNGALFDGEESFSKEEIRDVMSRYVDFSELLDERDKKATELQNYITLATHRLESRPEAIRKELLKEVKVLTDQHRALLFELQKVDRKVVNETNVLFQEIQNLRATINREANTKRSY